MIGITLVITGRREKDMDNKPDVDAAPVDAVVIRCPVCSREWPHGCEQWVAVAKRGKCIVCLVAAKETWESDPYDFQSLPTYISGVNHERD